ncbi:MAG: RNA polymerase sigma factor [Chloroflexi bacterium]|nr:MAG: RNA polymerase sigma factor [Chloroflexota bacterium]
MKRRTTQEWIDALSQPGKEQDRAIADLQDYLYRAVWLYLREKRASLKYEEADLRSMAEDFAQDAVLTIVNTINTFRGDSRFTTWAYRIVINTAVSELRRRRYKNLSLEQLEEMESNAFQNIVRADPEDDPDVTTEKREAIEQLRRILDESLNERQRYAIVSVYLLECSMQETAEQLETNVNNLYKLLHDARKKIKQHLDKHHMSPNDLLAPFRGQW